MLLLELNISIPNEDMLWDSFSAKLFATFVQINCCHLLITILTLETMVYRLVITYINVYYINNICFCTTERSDLNRVSITYYIIWNINFYCLLC